VARHFERKTESFRAAADDMVSLLAADCLVHALAAYQEWATGLCDSEVQRQRGNHLRVEQHRLGFTGFLFFECDDIEETLMLKAVNIVPRQTAQVAYAERGMYAPHDEDVVSDFPALQIISREFADLVLVPDGLSGFHSSSS
jgi:hypothetical protein